MVMRRVVFELTNDNPSKWSQRPDVAFQKLTSPDQTAASCRHLCLNAVSAPSGVGTLGNLHQEPQRSFDRPLESLRRWRIGNIASTYHPSLMRPIFSRFTSQAILSIEVWGAPEVLGLPGIEPHGSTKSGHPRLLSVAYAEFPGQVRRTA